MKIDRLLAVTLYLLNRDVVPASVLAGKFEVSRRTVQRDMDALNRAGIPVESVHGAQGGYRILDGFRPVKQIGGAVEYGHILAALQGLDSAYESPGIAQTLEKAQAAMRGGRQHVFLDFSIAREGPGIGDHLKTLEDAIAGQRPVEMEYLNARGESSRRVVEPLALSYRWYAWYLFAFCTLRQEYRLFKLVRILRCHAGEGVFSRAHGGTEALMAGAERRSMDLRRVYTVRIRCRPRIVPQVLEYLHCEEWEAEPGGSVVMTLRVPMERMWFSLLMGFGDQVQVLEPPEIRELLRRRAEEVLSVYAADPMEKEPGDLKEGRG